MKLVALGTICQQARLTIRSGERNDLRYVGLESIESGTGQIINGASSKTPDNPMANSFHFGREHILYGKLRPYLNKVALPNFEGKCSTEIIPLLPTGDADRAYIGYFLRSPRVIEQISARTSGARMPRADMDYILSLPVPLPPFPEQRRIVDLLTRAEGIVRLCRNAKRKAAELIPALFIDMFGDPAVNPKKWPVQCLGDLIVDGPQNGLYKHSSLYGEGASILRIDSFYDGKVQNVGAFRRVHVTPEEQQKYGLRERDIVINRVNSMEYLGKSAIIPCFREVTVFESNIMRFSVDSAMVLPEYLIGLLQTRYAKSHLLAKAKHAINQSSINQQDVKSLAVPVPPVEYQERYVRDIRNISSIQTEQTLAMRIAEDVFASLIGRSFSAGVSC